MPYSKIQDMNTTQSILAKVFNIGSVSIFSAYDNNQLQLDNVSDPGNLENIIFENIVSPKVFQGDSSSIHANGGNFNNHLENNEYYDEFAPITPINREIDKIHKEKEYHNDNRNSFKFTKFEDDNDSNFQSDQTKIFYPDVDKIDDNDVDEVPVNDYQEDLDYDYSLNVDEDDSSETVIRRHFDKFKK